LGSPDIPLFSSSSLTVSDETAPRVASAMKSKMGLIMVFVISEKILTKGFAADASTIL
jgi:hypothetical protein